MKVDEQRDLAGQELVARDRGDHQAQSLTATIR
jgi:hypothetical protein